MRPNDAKSQFNLGNALQAARKLDEAVACYRRAIELAPALKEARNNLGNTLKDLRRFDEAIDCLRRTLELNPNYAEAHNNLGAVFQLQTKLDAAAACYRQALALKPEYAEAWNNLGAALKDLGQVVEAIECFRRALALRADYFAAHRNLLYTLWFCPGVDQAAIYEEHCRWNERWAEPLGKDVAPHANERSLNRRLRIGYVSPDFREHCQAFFTVPLFSAHDREQFEIVCYADVVNPDGLTERLQSCVDQWRNIVGLNDEQIAQLVRQDEIDILIDLTMHMDRSHPLAFARKPAPVQVCWLAYPGTTGLKAIDYRLTDSYLDPPGMFDRYYSEQSIRLRDCFWCYDPLADGPAVNSLPANANGFITFGCLNNFCKLNEGVLELWARVLKAVEQSRLLLLAPEGSAREHVLRVLDQAGISVDRIAFVARQPRASYLELYPKIDVGLDTFPYNGHTTSLDSFWMGVPVVTLVGQTVVGRAGLCQLQNLGLPELIAQTPEQFVEIAVGLATDLSRLSRLRADLRERMTQSPLMDAPRFARSVEAAYRSMWKAWCVRRV